MNFARNTAGSFGTSIVTTRWDRRATLHHDHLAVGSPLSEHALATLRAGSAAAAQSYAALDRLIDVQAYVLSADDIFYASALLFVVLIAVIWLARPTRMNGAAGAAARAAH